MQVTAEDLASRTDAVRALADDGMNIGWRPGLRQQLAREGVTWAAVIQMLRKCSVMGVHVEDGAEIYDIEAECEVVTLEGYAVVKMKAVVSVTEQHIKEMYGSSWNAQVLVIQDVQRTGKL
jgi:hypothetical protein